MRPSLVYFLCASSLSAQLVRPEPQQAPIDALIQGYQSALNNANYDDAAAKRDQARALLSQVPVDDPQFANWAQRVAQIYDSGGLALQAGDVLEQALAKAGGLGQSSPARIAILDSLARSWAEDRNPLKAVIYLEQALTATEARPAQPTQAAAASPSPLFIATLSAAMPVFNRASVFSGRFSGANGEDLYRRLFTLYRQLGRPQDAANVLTRIAAHVKNSDNLIASLYQQEGQIDEAAAIYKRDAAQASDPQQAMVALQSLSNLYRDRQNYGDAATTLQQAISKIEETGQPDSIPLRQSLANLYQQSGQLQAADEVYQQLMSQPGNQQASIVGGYADFLTQTNHASQAETLLTNFQDSHTNLQPWEQNNLLLALARVERAAGKSQLADEYQNRAFSGRSHPANAATTDDTQRAMEAFNAGKLDEALALTLHALDSARVPSDIERAYAMTSMLSSRAPAKAAEIYRRILAVAESWSPATVEPLLRAQQIYAGAMQNQQQWSEFERAVESYKATLTAARGADTGWVEDSLRLRAGAFYKRDPQDALAASHELVALEHSLAGDTSEQYLRALETLAMAMGANRDQAGTLPLQRQIVTIADLVYTGSNETRRAMVRVNAGMAYAHAGQFDEGEALVREAVAITQHMNPPQPGFAGGVLNQILQMKQAAQPPAAPKQ